MPGSSHTAPSASWCPGEGFPERLEDSGVQDLSLDTRIQNPESVDFCSRPRGFPGHPPALIV